MLILYQGQFMSITSIKRHNHRVHACEKSRKQELLQHLITLYAGKSILVISAANTTTTQIEEKNLTLSNDDELAKMDQRQWDVLISFDLPKVSQDYLTRLEHTKEIALIMIDEKEQTLLYPIETLVGKNLPREVIPGFEVKTSAVKREANKPAPHRPTASQQREEQKKAKPSQRNHRYDGTVRSEDEKRKDFGKKPSGDRKPQIVKDSDKDRKEKKSFGKKEWDKKSGNSSSSNDYRNKKEATHTSSKPKRTPRVIKMPSENKSKES